MKKSKHKSPINLTGIIKNLEELILASSGVDPFEEILKLIYAKLYEEKNGNKTATPVRLLFEAAKKEWPGMFEKRDKIELTPSHLALCMQELEKVKLSGTDLRIIDTAFEYLLPKRAKGSRGQYFTPGYVITEIIKILNPHGDEFILDPACGSGGFLIQCAIFRKSSQKIYGVDYDMNMARIAKARMLISGFENTVIIRANALEDVEELNKQLFDVICTNPPFGGEIRDHFILANYELANDSRGKKRNYTERHILFIEKIIKMLKPGGRAAVIVPQGILNNTNLNYIREWIYSKARIIGVIGLNANTFKPHTNVKTSILFLKKWTHKPMDDYPVFMAVSTRSGKNLSGDKIYKMINGKQTIDTDLQEITTQFRKFVKKEGFDFSHI